jgi:hypothetical protein
MIEQLITEIEKAYSVRIAQAEASRGDYIMIEDIRDMIDAPRAELDAALNEIANRRIGELTPESNQKVLTEGQRAAAVTRGNQAKHLLAIY